MKKRNNSDKLREAVKYTNIAFQMIAIIGLGIAGGVYADRSLELPFPIFTVIASFLSVGLAIYISIKDFI